MAQTLAQGVADHGRHIEILRYTIITVGAASMWIDSNSCLGGWQELASEAEIFLSMDHPHVVRLFDVYEDLL
jgi:hypothetical protein